jgi:hypothetical protein
VAVEPHQQPELLAHPFRVAVVAVLAEQKQ